MPARKEGESIRFPHSLCGIVKMGAEDEANFCTRGKACCVKRRSSLIGKKEVIVDGNFIFGHSVLQRRSSD